jgi:exodeoxyribonuclease III
VRNIFLKIAVAALFQKEKIKGKLLLGLLILFYSIGAKDTRQGGRIMVYFEKQEKERIEMKMISWNVNGLRAAVGKGFLDYFKEADADIFSIQETKLQEGQIDLPTEGYHQYWNYAEKKGYSGVAVFTKQKPISVSYGLGIEEHDKEGRVITLEFENFYHVTVYTPNSQQENARLDYRMT